VPTYNKNTPADLEDGLNSLSQKDHTKCFSWNHDRW